jgi:cephalosporin hydroxylase
VRNSHSSLPSGTIQAIQAGHLKYTYKGVAAIKCPFDFALYSLLIWNLKPRTIFEIGSNAGGSALFLADQLRAFNVDGHVWSYDLRPVTEQYDPLVTFKHGDATNLGAAITQAEMDTLPRPFLVIEDSSHMRGHSLAVLKFFADNTRRNEYIVVEDGIVKDLGIAHLFDGGPADAVAEFLALHPNDWEIDTYYCDFFGENMTWNINGYLRKL